MKAILQAIIDQLEDIIEQRKSKLTPSVFTPSPPEAPPPDPNAPLDTTGMSSTVVSMFQHDIPVKDRLEYEKARSHPSAQVHYFPSGLPVVTYWPELDDLTVLRDRIKLYREQTL